MTTFINSKAHALLQVIRQLFIESYHIHFFADMKIKNLKIKTSFVTPDKPKAQANGIGINLIIFILVENCL